MSLVHPTSLRIPSAAKRRIAAAARRRGVTTQKFILDAALREAAVARSAEEQLATELVTVTRRHLARIAAEEDAADIRLAEERLALLDAGKTKLLNRNQAWREVGV